MNKRSFIGGALLLFLVGCDPFYDIASLSAEGAGDGGIIQAVARCSEHASDGGLPACNTLECYADDVAPAQTTAAVAVIGDPLSPTCGMLHPDVCAVVQPINLNPAARFEVWASGQGCINCPRRLVGAVRFTYEVIPPPAQGLQPEIVARTHMHCDLLDRPGGVRFDTREVLRGCAERQGFRLLDVGAIAWGDATFLQKAEVARCLADACSRANTFTSDRDRDGHGDICDNCPDERNPGQENLDGDPYGDTCDRDDDADGARDHVDNCPRISNPDQEDLDGDGDGDLCDSDDDGDGVRDHVDNCPRHANANQADFNEDGTGDVCQDSDEDGVNDDIDNCPRDANEDQVNSDGDDKGGDACDVPDVPEHNYVERPASESDLVWTDLTVQFDAMSDGQALTYPVDELEADGESYTRQFRAETNGREIDRRSLEPIKDLIDYAEDRTGATLGIIMGRHYEQWAGNTYCDSNAHAAAFQAIGLDPGEACTPEFRVPRFSHNFNNPRQRRHHVRRRLRNGEVREYVFDRYRRHDCHCRGVPGVIGPISEEYKSPRSSRPRYSQKYHEWLVDQCLDYRFSLTQMWRETFPGMGQRKKVYNKLNRSTTRGRAVLQYRLARDSQAMQQVMAECNFASVDGIFADTGIMSDTEAARRWTAAPPLDEPWSLMRWKVSTPGWHRPLDGVQGCDGGKVIHFASHGCPQLQGPHGLSMEDYQRECPLRAARPGILTTCAPDGGQIDVDEFTVMRFEEGHHGTGLPIISTPICPPFTINPTAKRVWEGMANLDRVRNRFEEDGFAEYFDSFVDLHSWGLPLWIGLSDSASPGQPVLRGQWVMIHEGVFFDDYRNRGGEVGVDPPVELEDAVLEEVSRAGGIIGIPEDSIDPDEARDSCFD